MFDKGEGSIELPEDVENSLLDAVWTMRWTENKESMYAVLEPEEAMRIVENIVKELDKIGYEIKKK